MFFILRLALATAALLLAYTCSSTIKVTSQFSNPETSDLQSSNLESLTRTAERVLVDDLAFYVTNDESNLYVLVDFISSKTFQNAREFGFTFYVDGENSIRRSFGIIYPTGIYHQLGNYPGAQKGYLEEPNWSNFQENRGIKQTAERSSTQNALLIQRQNRRDPMQPVSLPLTQFNAQNVRLYLDDDGRTGRISLTIPLQTRSTSQFSPDIKPGETIDLGFEIDPIRLHDMDMRSGAPLITSETTGGRSQSETDQENRERINRLRMRMGEPYETWVKVTLSTRED